MIPDDLQKRFRAQIAGVSGRGYAEIFPDKNKKKTIDVSENISKEIAAFSFGSKSDREAGYLTICVGISENPIDGVQADGLYVKAQDRMKMAKSGAKLLEAFA